jgi:RNase P subunit RPR2
MSERLFKYVSLSAPTEFTANLSSTTRQTTSGAPTLVAIQCGACDHAWKYRVVTEGLSYAAVTCPSCGRREPYSGST